MEHLLDWCKWAVIICTALVVVWGSAFCSQVRLEVGTTRLVMVPFPRPLLCRGRIR
jgi:hypothetical protein